MAEHGVTVVGILSAFVVFQSVFVAFGFGVLLHFITLGLEKTAFSCHHRRTCFPLPAFSLPLSEWLGMAFGWASSPGMDGRIALVAMQVADTGAQRLSDLFWRWIEDDPNNEADRVQASVVFLDDTHYRIFLYPKFSSPEMEERYAELECQAAPTSLDDVHDQLLVMCVLKQGVHHSPDLYPPRVHRPLQPSGTRDVRDQVPGNGEPAPGTRPFTVRSLKVIHADELTKTRRQYDFIKLEI